MTLARAPRVALLLALAAGLGCARPAGSAADEFDAAQDDLRSGRSEEGVRRLERLVARYPIRVDYREPLMRAHFELAMQARRESRMRDYTDHLERAYEHGFAILKLEPRSVSVHLMMGLVAAHQGRVERALTSFDNCRRLEPEAAEHHLNMAESLVYLGRLARARHYIARARAFGSAPVDAELVELLAGWRNDDYTEVNELFDIAYTLNPEAVRSWNDPDEPIESFADFKRHCCTLPFCGPHMGERCPAGLLRAALPTVDPETRRRELVLEMLRRRELEAIYRERKDLEIVVEDVDEPEEEPGPALPR
jgi:tetratricopeptide (TPR) repeat protein